MKRTLILIIMASLFSCSGSQEINEKSEYPRWVGDSEFDPTYDDSTFNPCNGDNNIKQYFNLGKGPVYAGEKSALIQVFENHYKPTNDPSQNGLVRVRFVVNCEGRAGRFRVIQSDTNYKETEFHEKIISQLTEITKGVEKWEVLYNEDGKAVDYYHYLVFKISNGDITEILP